jgi:FkbM family methyltransferase
VRPESKFTLRAAYIEAPSRLPTVARDNPVNAKRRPTRRTPPCYLEEIQRANLVALYWLRLDMGHNSSPKLTRYLVDLGILRDEPFSLVDVGASGGIEPHWREFDGSLRAVAFDPLIKEMERLKSIEPNPSVHYFASLVGYREMAKLTPGSAFSTDPYYRTSSVRAAELLRCDYTNTYIDQTHDGTVTNELVELDEFFRDHPADVDFIKVDTDGDDYAVLLGSRKLLSGAGPIGLAVETPLVGADFSHGNIFANVDRYLQGLGYSLFSIEPRFQTRAALPKPFRWSEPADTHAGQARWADTLFFRDVCIPGYEKHFNVVATPHKLLKLCCAYELFSFEHCAAEVLVQFRDRIQPVVEVGRCLDLLTPPLPGGQVVSYREYIEFFEGNVEAFYSGC